MSPTNGKPLRFAALIRVSTEKQAQVGESLRTQKGQITADVEQLQGKVVSWYGGQEHATPGHEKHEVERLLRDAAKHKFDAVIVAHADRWSRDNASSKAGLKIFKQSSIRFFVRTMEYDLFNPTHTFYLGMSAELGELQAGTQSLKSIQNRIARAKRGIPTGGKIPFGRIYDKAKHEWSIDATKQAMIQDVATRYLAGEPLSKLAKEYGINHSNLCKVLRERCGPGWNMEFQVDALNIRETVPFHIPRLLPDKTIKALRLRLEANKTYLHGKPKHQYRLVGRVFCATCGYGFFGQTNRTKDKRAKKRYYRHAHTERTRQCPHRPRPWVSADRLEQEVVGKLFDLFGNPSAIERAINAATPDCDGAVKKRSRLEKELAKVVNGRNRVLSLVAKGLVTDSQAERQLAELNEREGGLNGKLEQLADALCNVPNAAQVHQVAKTVHRLHGMIIIEDEEGNQYAGGNDVQSYIMMSDDDRRALLKAAFDEPAIDGKPSGVYITPDGGDYHGPKRFRYELRGQLLSRVTPRALP